MWMYAYSTPLSQLEGRNSLEIELEHENIYPPTNFIKGLERSWIAWRRDELNNEQV